MGRWWFGLFLAFVALLGGCRPPAPTPNPALVQRGEVLYNTHCLSCHGGREGRPPDPYAPPHTTAGHTWHHPDGQLKEIILNGLTGRGTMPAFRGVLSEEDVEAILAYIKTWWGPAERAYQAEVSRRWEEARRQRSPR